MIFKLSPSSMSLMKECERCFWLDKHKVWQRPSGIFPSLPSGMDAVLKRHFDIFRDKNRLPPELCEGRNGECDNMKLFGANDKEKELLNDWRNNLRGIRWEDENGNILFGAVDNILVKGKKLIVLDYKTRGFPLKEDTPEYYRNQLDIYNLLLNKNGFETEDYSFLLFYIPEKVSETGEVIFDTKLIKMKVDVENGEKLFLRALKLLNSACPEQTCEWCENVSLSQ